MAIEYISSDKIKVFPAAFRSGDVEAKRTTEENLIKFNRVSSNINNLNQMFEDPDDANYIIFNIHGYWFRCLKTDITGNNTYAFIKLYKEEGVGWRLSSSSIGGSALDDEGEFKGLGFTSDLLNDIPSGDATTVKYYSLQVTDSAGELLIQNLKLDSTEIRNGDESTKSISEEFNVENLTAETATISEIKAPTGKTLKLPKTYVTDENKNVTINGNVTIGSGGFQTGAHKITFNTMGASIVTLPSSGILATTARTEKLTNKVINGIDIKKSDNGFKLSVNGDESASTLIVRDRADVNIKADVDINGKVTIGSGDITSGDGAVTFGSGGFETGAHKITFNTTEDSTLYLPSAGTLATITGQEELTNKVINGIKIEEHSPDGFKLSVNGNESASKLIIQNGADVNIESNVNINGDVTIGNGGFETSDHKITFSTTKVSTLDLPSEGKLATIEGQEELTNKVINGINIKKYMNGFKLSVNGNESASTLIVRDMADVKIKDDVEIGGEVTIGGGGITSDVGAVRFGVDPVSMLGKVSIPANSKLEISDYHAALGKVEIIDAGAISLNPVKFVIDSDATTRTEIYAPKGGTNPVLHLPSDNATPAQKIWAQQKVSGIIDNSWLDISDEITDDNSIPTSKAVHDFVNTSHKILWEGNEEILTDVFKPLDIIAYSGEFDFANNFDEFIIEWTDNNSNFEAVKTFISRVKFTHNNANPSVYKQTETKTFRLIPELFTMETLSFSYYHAYDINNNYTQYIKIGEAKKHVFSTEGTTVHDTSIFIKKIVGVRYFLP